MKFLSSSSSSAASTTTAATATAGCLAGMLRRLLCFNSLPTHPSDQIKDLDLNTLDFDKFGCLLKTLLSRAKLKIQVMFFDSRTIVIRNSHIAREAAEKLRPINHKKEGEEKKEKEESVATANKVETESDSENSSPVSVLDFAESIFDPKVSTSAEADARVTSSNSRRKLSAELENFSDIQRKNNFEDICHGSRKKDFQRENYEETCGEICKMVEGEMMESNWAYRELWKLEDFEDIGAVFELHIVEELTNELVEQLLEKSQ
ncbi:hypothetical protein Acr_23g0016910 [Actinidia rufa]|uniref:DUF4378 domain-containing protein n=1 Tax=Actinidia rufa TaxID=165716 RepID=A0A7J0GR70_9ERIC|nr:hypothetical protein Acr_23g0016910 [Actinidia rufa]